MNVAHKIVMMARFLTGYHPVHNGTNSFPRSYSALRVSHLRLKILGCLLSIF